MKQKLSKEEITKIRKLKNHYHTLEHDCVEGGIDTTTVWRIKSRDNARCEGRGRCNNRQKLLENVS